VVAVGLDRTELGHFLNCHVAARIDNSAGVDNDERGAQVERCSGTRGRWSQIWPDLRHLG
jgi:hypothetical protein